jgi:Ca2+/Na+ antiporter
MATRRSFGRPVFSLLGLIVFIALVWLVLALVKGVVGIVLTVLLFILAAVVVWRLVKTGVHKAT